MKPTSIQKIKGIVLIKRRNARGQIKPAHRTKSCPAHLDSYRRNSSEKDWKESGGHFQANALSTPALQQKKGKKHYRHFPTLHPKTRREIAIESKTSYGKKPHEFDSRNPYHPGNKKTTSKTWRKYAKKYQWSLFNILTTIKGVRFLIHRRCPD